MRHVASIAFSLSALALLTGCGGTTVKAYSAGGTTECLNANAPEATIDYLDVDRLSRSASGGAYRVGLDRNFAVLAFWGSTKAASTAVKAYGRFVAATGVRPSSVLRRARNVSIEWETTPGRSDAQSIAHCLRP